jgi:hypothetical protein
MTAPTKDAERYFYQAQGAFTRGILATKSLDIGGPVRWALQYCARLGQFGGGRAHDLHAARGSENPAPASSARRPLAVAVFCELRLNPSDAAAPARR